MQIPVIYLTQNMPWSVAYQAVLTEVMGMNPTAVGWLMLIQFLVVFCTHSHPPQLCHIPEVKKVTYFYCWEACATWLQLQMPCALAKRSFANTHQPFQDAANNGCII